MFQCLYMCAFFFRYSSYWHHEDESDETAGTSRHECIPWRPLIALQPTRMRGGIPRTSDLEGRHDGAAEASQQHSSRAEGRVPQVRPGDREPHPARDEAEATQDTPYGSCSMRSPRATRASSVREPTPSIR